MTMVPRNNQDNLQRTISTPQAVGIAFNQVVGGGVVSLTGAAIALTGGGAPLAYLLAALSIVIVSLPYAAIGSAMPVTGGAYTYVSRLIHPILGYVNMCFFALSQTSLGLYGIVAGQYMHSLNPWFDQTLVAFSMITSFYIANMLGAVFGARLSMILMIVHIAAFVMFIAFGFWHFDWVNYPPVLPHGFGKLLQAAAMLTFATGGALIVVELGSELKNPGMAIPVGVFVGTLLAALLYVAIAAIAAGTLPIAQVANQPLSVVAAHFLPPAALQFFIVGGAVVAVIGTTNGMLLCGSKSLLAAVDDGWFPKASGAVNRRFGTPHFLLTLLYIVGLMPIVFGIPLDMIASSVSAMGQLMFVFVNIAALRMRYVRPDLHAAAPFKLGLRFQWLLTIVGSGVCVVQSALLLSQGLSGQMLLTFVIVVVFVLGWGFFRYPHVRRLNEINAKL
jgi:APA family basic amino acid/polyamine antiporter